MRFVGIMPQLQFSLHIHFYRYLCHSSIVDRIRTYIWNFRVPSMSFYIFAYVTLEVHSLNVVFLKLTKVSIKKTSPDYTV